MGGALLNFVKFRTLTFAKRTGLTVCRMRSSPSCRSCELVPRPLSLTIMARVKRTMFTDSMKLDVVQRQKQMEHNRRPLKCSRNWILPSTRVSDFAKLLNEIQCQIHENPSRSYPTNVDNRIQNQELFVIPLAQNQCVSPKSRFGYVWICGVHYRVENIAIYSKSAHGAYPNVSKRI
jgi:hypothetical protein